LLRASKLCLFCYGQIISGVRTLHCAHLSTSGEGFQTVLTDGLQHYKPRLFPFLFGLLHQALVNEGGYDIDDLSCCMAISKCGGDCLDCLQGTAANKDGEAAEDPLLIDI
jgi:hypothetical protein